MGLIKDSPAVLFYSDYGNCYRYLFYDFKCRGDINDLTVLKPDGALENVRNLVRCSDDFEYWFLHEFVPLMWSLKKPWILTNGDTTAIEKIEFSQEDQKNIKKEGLHVFYFEPLFLCNQDKSWPWTEGKTLPLIPELNFLKSMKDKLKPRSRITVYNCEDGLGEYLHQNEIFKDIDFISFNTHLLYASYKRSAAYYKDFSYCDKKLLCLNFRYESVREILIAYIRSQGYHHDSLLTYYHYHHEPEFKRRLPFDATKLSKWSSVSAGIQAMQSELPLVLDSENPKAVFPHTHGIPDIDLVSNKKVYTGMTSWYRRSFVNLICESRPYYPRGEISEKTVAAIEYGRPFILMAAPYTLRSLRKLGFKTFDDIWDESYDLEENPLKRTDMVLELIDFVFSLDTKQLKSIQMKISDRILHNRYILFTEMKQKMLSKLPKGSNSWIFR